MGCDIHLFCERKYKDKWFSADYYMRNIYYNKNEDEGLKMEAVPLYDNRNYTLFSILANVRNGSNNEYISQPKGLPDDISKKVMKEYKVWEFDAHSCSWFTAKELFDWIETHKTTKYSGMISPDDAKKLDEENIYPTIWCGWTNQREWVYREWEKNETPLDYLVKRIKERMAVCFKIYDFYNEDQKEELYKKHSEEFRIVFWFDN